MKRYIHRRSGDYPHRYLSKSFWLGVTRGFYHTFIVYSEHIVRIKSIYQPLYFTFVFYSLKKNTPISLTQLMVNLTQTNHEFMFIQTVPHLKCREQTILILKPTRRHS